MEYPKLKTIKIAMIRLGRPTISTSTVVPPLGIMSLAAYIRERHPSLFLLIDQRVDSAPAEDLVRRIADFEPDIVGLSLLTTASHEVPEFSKSLHRALPKALLVMGGPHVTAFAQRALDDSSVDLGAMGEGERTFDMIVEACRGDKTYGHIPGLIRREGAETIINEGEMPFIKDVDALPFPAFDLLDLQPYWVRRSHAQLPPRRYIPIHSSRGCPFQCIYCHHVFGKSIRSQSPERIVAEVRHFSKVIGTSEVEFLDDTFNFDRKHVAAFADEVNRQNLKLRITFPNGLRGDILTEETADALVHAGTYYSSLALESGSERIQALIGKRLNIPRFLAGVDMLARRGVFTNGFSMLGFPTETLEEMERTVDVMCESRLHTGAFFTVVPFPKTELYELASQTHPERLVNIHYENADYVSSCVNLSDAKDEELFACQRKAWRRFYLNPKRAWRIVRTYPNPGYLVTFVPMFTLRLLKGLI